MSRSSFSRAGSRRRCRPWRGTPGPSYGSTGTCTSPRSRALENLYPGLSPGGYCIVDDYGTYSACRQAVEDYRAKHDIEDPIVDIDGSGAYWRRTTEP